MRLREAKFSTSTRIARPGSHLRRGSSFLFGVQNPTQVLDFLSRKMFPLEKAREKWCDLAVEKSAEKRATGGMGVIRGIDQRPEVMFAPFLVKIQGALVNQSAQQCMDRLGFPVPLPFQRLDDLIGGDRRFFPDGLHHDQFSVGYPGQGLRAT